MPEVLHHRDNTGNIYDKINDWQTRILILKPGSFGETLVSELLVVDLIHGHGVVLHNKQLRVQYEAISYCWGDTQCKKTIYCNEIPCLIADNLFLALQRLRQTNSDRFIWVDALCINQSNNEEKSKQISNMLLIFQKAQSVLVWLGEQSFGDTDFATRFIRQPGCFKYGWLHVEGGLCRPSYREQKSSSGSLETESVMTLPLCLGHASRLSQALQDLLNRPFYRRVWVVQEIWAAQNILVLCGEIRFSWQELQDMATLADVLLGSGLLKAEEGSHFGSLFNSLGPMARSDANWNSQQKTKYRSNCFLIRHGTFDRDLINVLRRTARSICSDPRDHIYGVIGMSNTAYGIADSINEIGPRITIDYGQSVTGLFTDVAWYFIKRDLCLQVLCLDVQYGGEVDGQLLPSWVPDWTTLSSSFWEWNYHPGEDILDSYHGYFDPNDLQHKKIHRMLLENPPISINPNELHLEGCLVGQLRSITYSHPMPTSYSGLSVKLSDVNLSESAIAFGSDARYTGFRWMLPAGANSGDLLIAVKGCFSLILIRLRSVERTYKFVGPAIPFEKLHGGDSSSAAGFEWQATFNTHTDFLWHILRCAQTRNCQEFFTVE
ncbi:hypothetical protein M433DRAFT_116040 [Acidomyces richmondensis BFW]|nr:MAG: hypothetical protein FE78DRAFT_160662 [Acidomyces sp. 'richmondensis']KYG41182.1 hypothetical protein M433DRAFT_116040 [Acidomyces richmondensis BFW]